MIFREAKARFQSQRKPTTNRFPLCKNGANSGCWDGKGGGNPGIVERRLCIVTRLGLNWRIEYFFPVILRRRQVSSHATRRFRNRRHLEPSWKGQNETD